MKDISAEDITVTADMTQIVDFNTTPVVVPLQCSCKNISSKNITLSRNTIPVEMDTIETKEITISPSAGSGTVDKDYEIGKMTASVSTITVSGASSVIDNIDTAVAVVDVTGLSSSKTLDATLTLIDRDQNETPVSEMEDDITIEGGVPDITVNVELWKKKSGIGLKAEYSGSPADGYVVSSVVLTPDDITVAGTEEVLEELEKEGNLITIPAEYIDISGAQSDVVKELKLEEFLPENSKLSSSTNETVTVKITILKQDVKEVAFDTSNIEIKNQPSGLAVAFEKKNIKIKVKSMTDDFSSFDEKNISASIDLKDFKAGEYDVPVSVTLPDGFELETDVSVSVNIKEKE